MSHHWIRVVTGVQLSAATVVFFLSYGRSNIRCKESCFGDPPLSRYGSISYEPGHPWTRYADSWQWTAQSILGDIAIIAAIVAAVLSWTARRNPRPALALSVAAMIAWIVWVTLSPATS